MAEVTVIIVSYNSQPLLGKCLDEALAANPQLDQEIIVVDNGSSDTTVAFVRERYPQVRLICNDDNRGFAGANNQAIVASDAPYVVLLNPDCWQENDALTQMRDYLREHPECGMVGPRMHDGQGQPLASAHSFETLRTLTLSLLGLHRLLPAPLRRLGLRLVGHDGEVYRRNFEAQKPCRVDWLCGACVMVPRGVIDRLGALDEGYMMYLEDEEWCLRMARHGLQTVYLPAARAVHDVSYAPPSAAKVRFTYASGRRYHRLHNARTYPLIYLLLTFRYLRDLWRARSRREGH